MFGYLYANLWCSTGQSRPEALASDAQASVTPESAGVRRPCLYQFMILPKEPGFHLQPSLGRWRIILTLKLKPKNGSRSWPKKWSTFPVLWLRVWLLIRPGPSAWCWQQFLIHSWDE